MFQSGLFVLSLTYQFNDRSTSYAGTKYAQHTLCICCHVFIMKGNQTFVFIASLQSFPAGLKCRPIKLFTFTFWLTMFLTPCFCYCKSVFKVHYPVVISAAFTSFNLLSPYQRGISIRKCNLYRNFIFSDTVRF